MAEIAIYINFDGNARQAMEFYKSVFGGKLNIQTVGESFMSGQQPSDMQDKVFHSSLEGEDFVLMASDLQSEESYKKGNSMTPSLLCKSKDEIQGLFGKLSGGGKVTMPLADSQWNSIFGMVEDKFGIAWMLNYDKSINN